jgi:hypothetical protein
MADVEQVESIKFLDVHNIILRRLKRFGMGHQILKKLYNCTIESILTCCITVWSKRLLDRFYHQAIRLLTS